MKNTFAAIKYWMDKILSIACAILLSFMTILVLIQVFTRFVLNNPVAFTEELVRYSLIWTGFIGAAYAFSTREHMSLTLIRDKFTGKAHTALLVAIDGLILLMAIFVFTIGGFKLAVSASREFSALLGIPRSLVYAIAPISGVFIVIAQIINIWRLPDGRFDERFRLCRWCCCAGRFCHYDDSCTCIRCSAGSHACCCCDSALLHRR